MLINEYCRLAKESSTTSTRSQSPQNDFMLSASASSSTQSSLSASNTSTRSTSPTHQLNQRRTSPTDLLTLYFQLDLNQPNPQLVIPSSSSNFNRSVFNTNNYSTLNSAPAADSSNHNSNENDEMKIYKPLNNLFEYSLSNQLHLMRKDTLMFLIESNLKINLLSPFDLFAYDRLKRINRVEPECSKKFNYNYPSVRRMSRFISQRFGRNRGGGGGELGSGLAYNPLDPHILEKNALLPNCMSTFLMPFYFDIFKITELGSFPQEHVQLMLALKKSFKAQIYLDYDTLITYLRENILWNCFILFKYWQIPSSATRMGYFNFYLSFVQILVHLEQVNKN